jgi:hypothetical protein
LISSCLFARFEGGEPREIVRLAFAGVTTEISARTDSEGATLDLCDGSDSTSSGGLLKSNCRCLLTFFVTKSLALREHKLLKVLCGQLLDLRRLNQYFLLIQACQKRFGQNFQWLERPEHCFSTLLRIKLFGRRPQAIFGYLHISTKEK